MRQASSLALLELPKVRYKQTSQHFADHSISHLPSIVHHSFLSIKMGVNKLLLANAALAAVAYASPAPQQLDFAAISAAPAVASGPSAIDADGGEQTASLYTSFSVTGATTAPAAPSTTAKAKREDAVELLSKRTFNKCCPVYDPWCFFSPNSCNTGKPQPTTSKAPTTTAKPTTTSAPAVTSACAVSAYTPYYAALATGYTTDPALSATRTTTANQPCPTTPEAGTYCGFISEYPPSNIEAPHQY